ncbi:hypothetical protein EV356DRAFT_505680 [Viridothelium virens]|uniref:intramembrane prenyl-peptidase Rce1 n=1 Tax=Viridothelium virens TaxID=1048519 RepID=A0A6A6H3F5_VIRVR|nr:hypothetical protein EV356DRAFT_505680 [Viridothelium virens]
MAPILNKSREVLERLRKHRTQALAALQGPVHQDPAISSSSATLLSVILTILFVLPLYASPTTRPSQTLTRDAPSVIKARIRALAFSCCVSALVTIFITSYYGGASIRDTFHLLGWWPINLLDIVRSLLLVAILFAGPLFESGVVDGQLQHWLSGSTCRDMPSSWIGIRNYVAGPMTEEVLFRSLLTPLHLLSLPSPAPPSSVRPLIFTLPLYFGIAHIHHLYEFRLRHPSEPVSLSLLRVLLQFSYTSVFGFIAEFVFLRTGSLLACVLAHAFCNAMGLPRVWGQVGEQEGNGLDELAGDEGEVVIGPPEGERKKKDEPLVTKKASVSLSVAWTVAYYALLVGGAAAFWTLLYPLTDSKLALSTL